MLGAWFWLRLNHPIIHDEPAPPQRTQHAAPSAQPSEPASTVVASASPPARELHEAPAPFDQRACLARTGARVPATHTVHRWIDANGVTHYSDKPPQQNENPPRDHTLITARDPRPVLVEIESLDAELPVHIRDRANGDAVAIGRVFDDVLGIDTQGGLALRIVLAGTDDAYRTRAGRDPDTSPGVYRSASRSIVVRTQARPEYTLAILRHEIVHALVHEWIGNLPIAMNEGLAEYFEHFAASGMGGSVDPNDYARRMRAERASGDARSELLRLLELPHEDFHMHQRSAHYTRSLALVSTLMAEPMHRPALAAVLQAQHETPCQPVDAARVLERFWPGGLTALADAWEKHQSGQSLPSHTY